MIYLQDIEKYNDTFFLNFRKLPTYLWFERS